MSDNHYNDNHYGNCPRLEVAQFAVFMEQVLRDNDHKGGWRFDSPESLFMRVVDEMADAACDPLLGRAAMDSATLSLVGLPEV